jgi:hypothetical protein
MSKYYTFADDFDFGKARTAIKLEIKKLNKNNQLCYYDSVDLTCKNITDEQLEIFVKMFSSAGFITNIKRHTYFGIYDPSRMVELVEIYPTDEELLQRDLLL